MEASEYDDDKRYSAHAPQEMLSYLYNFSVFFWTSEDDSNTQRVDAYFFENGEKKSLFSKIYVYMWTALNRV